MTDVLKFDEESRITVKEPMDVQKLHLKDLTFVLEVDADDDGTVRSCTLDMEKLLIAMTVYSSQDRFRYGWRRLRHDRAKQTDDRPE